jgi:hypothetical protein
MHHAVVAKPAHAGIFFHCDSSMRTRHTAVEHCGEGKSRYADPYHFLDHH